MATNTTNYNLKKPATTDKVSIADINANMDTIDAQIKANADLIAGKQDTILAGKGISIGSDGKTINHSNSITARTSYLGGSTSVPMIMIDAQGHITAYTYTTIYPPTTSGTSGQIWTSDGSGQGVWKSKDTAPTSGSTNAITSGAVYTELAKKQNVLTFDSSPASGSSNPVTSGGVFTALEGKQDAFTFDSSPTSGSSNPVTSDGIYTAINDKQDKITLSTSEPSGGSDGDIWFVYE